MSTQLSGVFAASVTPLKTDGTLALDELPGLLDFLSERGCHGALLFGTTGEGPSFSPTERITLFRQALAWRETHPGFCLLAGTGTPSLEETVELTQAAFDLGMDGTVTLPPYYYRTVSDEGLFVWFSQTIRRAVPQGGAFFGYHFPRVSGVPLSIGLLERLKDTFPTQFAGIKDSSGDPELTRQLGQRFGKDLTVLTGSDRLFGMALENNASGCITALANLLSLDLRKVWDAFQHGKSAPQAQARLDATRDVMDRYPPAPPLLKALLARLHGLPNWAVRPPLLPLSAEFEDRALGEFLAATLLEAASLAGEAVANA